MKKTMKLGLATLAVVLGAPSLTRAGEGRTPIPFESPLTFPIRITEGGEYVLTRNLADTSGVNVIEIATTEPVTVDLNGMTITATQPADGADVGSCVASVVANEALTIRNGVLKRGHRGIRVESGGDLLTIEDVSVQDTVQGIAVNGVTSVHVRRCLVREVNAVVGSLSWGIRAVFSPNVIIEDCTVLDSDREAIVVQLGGSLGSFAVRRNQVRSAGLDGISIVDMENGIVSENLVNDALTCIGVVGGRNVEVVSNLVRLSADLGISVIPSGIQASEGVTLRDNRVLDCSGVGLRVNGIRSRVEGNHLASNGGYGLLVEAADVVLSRNSGVGNGGSGCTGTARGSDACFTVSPTSFGDNLIPPSMGLF